MVVVMGAVLAGAVGCGGEKEGSAPPASQAAAPAPAPAPTPAPAPAPAPEAAPAGPADGKEVYGLYCVSCHGPGGKGDGPAAPADPKPRDFTVGDFKYDADGDGKPGTTADIQGVITNGAAKYGGSPLMVPWGLSLNPAQVEAVAKYVQELKGS